MNSLKKLRFISLLLFLLLYFPVFAVFVSVSDGEVGENLNVRISELLSEENVSLELHRPKDSSIKLSAKADESGILMTSIEGIHLQYSGIYELNVLRQYDLEKSIKESFFVEGGKVSSFRSEIEGSDSVISADGARSAEFVITARDIYDNLLKGKNVQVVSSRNEDKLSVEKITNEQGIARGTISSETPGVSVLSVLVDGVVLHGKMEIVFHLPQNPLGNVGNSENNLGKFLKAQLFEEVNESVAYFAFEDLGTTIEKGKQTTFRLAAKNEDGEVVTNYTGTVRFSSSDTQAQLPIDYTYTASDQGAHTFALALTFQTAGEQELVANDVNDFDIKGDFTIEVQETATSGGDSRLRLITPLAGTYSTSRMTITGKGTPGLEIKLVDGPTVMTENLIIDASGDFIYQTPRLADGLHKFLALTLDEATQSNELEVRIDQTPPRVLSVILDPEEGIEPESFFQIKVSSNEALSSVSCVFNAFEVSHRQVGDVFVGDYKAPKVCGEYPFSCSAADLLGNELDEPNAGTVEVCSAEVPEVTEPPVLVAPTAVSNLSAVGGEKKVTLHWSPAKDDGEVDHYQILFGLTPTSLNQENLTPDNRTQWYVDGLEVATKYYFRVIAFDNEGNKGPASAIVEATTNGEVLHSSAVPRSGGAFWNALLLALAGGLLFLFVSRRNL